VDAVNQADQASEQAAMSNAQGLERNAGSPASSRVIDAAAYSAPPWAAPVLQVAVQKHERSSQMQPFFKFLHLAGVVVWVGGMFFAWMCLRPVAAANLEPPARLKLWADVFARFFPWVWGCVLTVVFSGLVALGATGMRLAPPHWHVMLLLGLVMSVIFVYVFLAPYAELKTAVSGQDWPAGAKALGRIRQLIGTNLILGLTTIAVATLGSLRF
jgi:uncharacterized membrane protein